MRCLSFVTFMFAILLSGLVSTVAGQECDSIPSHFVFTDSTGGSYAVVIDSAVRCSLNTCDEIGVFDGELCVGATVFEGSWPVTVTAWADDDSTAEKDGYTAGKAMSFRIWRAADSTEAAAAATYALGDGTFGHDTQAELFLGCCTYPEPPGQPIVSDTNPCHGADYVVSWESVAGAVSYRLLENGEPAYEGADTTATMANTAGEYEYTVQACGPCECSAESPSEQVSIDSLPPAPGGFSIAPDTVCVDNLFCLTWDEVAGAIRYEYRRGEGPWQNVGYSLQRCISPDSAGAFAYQVRACDSCGCGPASTVDSVAVIAAAAAVDSLELEPATACVAVEFCLSWNDVEGADEYEVRQGDGPWMDIGTSTQACFTHGTPGDYTYYVRAQNECGWTEPATSRTVTVKEIPSSPQQPDVSLNPVCLEEQYCLTWGAIAGADRYEIRENGGAWQNTGDTTSWCTSQSLAGAYGYEIRACNGCGCSAPSPLRAVSIQTIPAAPGIPNVTSTSVCLGEQYCVGWSAVPTATTYQYSENGGDWIDAGDTTNLCFSHDTAGLYTYRIRAGNACGMSDPSPGRTVTVEEAVGRPSQPVVDDNPACIGRGYCVDWAPVGGATRYEVREDSGNWFSVGSLTRGCYASMIPGERVYEVRACDNCDCSPPSDPVVISILNIPQAPAQLVSDDSLVCPEEEFCLSWDSVESAQRYELRDQAGLWVDMGVTTDTCISHATPGGYNYEVRACNPCSCSTPSSAVSILVSPPPSPPPAPTIQPNPVCADEELCIEWSMLPGVESYQLRRDSGTWTDYGDTNRACLTLDSPGEYVFEMRVCDECGCSDAGDPVTVTVPDMLSPPEQVVASADSVCTGQEFCVSWSSVDSAVRYETRLNGGAWTPAGLDTTLCEQPTQSGDYSFEVRACDECGCSSPAPSAVVSVSGHPASPPAPTATPDTACVGGNICLTWPDDSSADYYQVREVGGVWLDAGDSLSYCLSRSSPGEYRFVVRACNECGCSDESAMTTVVFQPEPPVPGVPIIVSEPICVGAELCMQWAPVDGAERYEWQQDNGPWVDVDTAIEHCIQAAPYGEHRYRVRACAPCGCGEPGPPVTVQIGTVPATIDSVEVSADPVCQGGEFCLWWDAVAGAKVYHVSVDDGPWQSIGGSRTYCDTIATTEDRSYYVRGCNDCGCGNAAPEVIVSPAPLPGRPSLADCNFEGSQLLLGWTSVVDADEYQVYRDGLLWMTTSDTTLLTTPDYGGEHSFFVRASNDCGPGESSDTCVITLPTDIEDEGQSAGLPREFALGQNYPNPFNPETRIDFALPRSSRVHLEIVNMLGRTVRVLVDRRMPAGHHSVIWDGADESGKIVSSGVYFYRMKAGSFSTSRKMLLMR